MMEFTKEYLAIAMIEKEYNKAISKHRKFNSAHEGYAVIKEELDELWEEIRLLKSFEDNKINTKMLKEAKQIAAMALRFMVDICGNELEKENQ